MLMSNLTFFFNLCKKNHCELDFWSIWTNFASKYAQKLKVFDKKKTKKNIFRHIMGNKMTKRYFFFTPPTPKKKSINGNS